MATVRVLPDQVANQIAAGEVIERPASVIKELVENSVDAGATRIEVEFRNGGASYMRIEDNGSGMSRDDALLSLERHATSKIRKAKDLDGLLTMGFRGEALPSIASVSRFQLQTREAGSESGTEIMIDGGRILHVRDCGMPQGTRLTVSRLFNTVPARRKFLRSVTTEAAHIVHCVRLYALAHPEIGFTLIDDGRVLFQSPSCDSLLTRVTEIFGKQIATSLLEVDVEEEGMRLRGRVGKPSLSRSTRHEMLLFVNNRPVENKTLSYALVESYYGHIPKGRYPVAFLFLDIAPDRIDVNVHPAKREIRFREEAKARGFAVRTILQALREENDALGRSRPVEVRPSESTKPLEGVTAAAPPVARRLVDTTEQVSPPPRIEQRREVASAPQREVSPPAPVVEATPENVAPVPTVAAKNWNYIGWVQGEFAVFDTGAGVVLLSVRGAQQRILYEQLLRDFRDRAIRCQRLLLPHPLELDPVSSALIEESLSFFKRLGFEIAPFGRNFFRIEGTPTWLEENKSEEFVKEIVGLLRQGVLTNEKDGVAVDLIAKRAAARLTRPRDEPLGEEVDALVDKLFACEKPLTDPEGRPSLIEFSSGEIDRRFQRRNRSRQPELF